MERKNCWEVKKCGRQQGGENTEMLGVCPAALPGKYDETNNGAHGGRFCWTIAGTFCAGKVQGTFASKINECLNCDFLKQVNEEEGQFFILTPSIHRDESKRLLQKFLAKQEELEVQEEEVRKGLIEIEKSRNKYSDLYDFAPIGYFTFDAHGVILEVNLAGANILGFERRFLVNTPLSCYVSPEFTYTLYSHLHKVFETKTRQTTAMQLLKKDGTLAAVLLDSNLKESGKESPAYCLSVMSDITEHKRAEEELRSSEEKFRSVVDNIAIGISLISPNMEILSLNKQRRAWFPEIEAYKKPICYKSFNNPPRGDICPYCPTYKTLKDGEVHESITETPVGDKTVNYRVISAAVKDDKGNVIAAIEMVEDITGRKQA